MKGYIRKRGSSYSFTVDIGRDPITGKRKQKTKSGFKTKKEAQSALNETLYQLDKGLYIKPSKMTVREYVDMWTENKALYLRPTTAEQYESKIKKWIVPYLGEYLLEDLKPIHGQEFVKFLLNSLSSETAHKVFAITNSILYDAVKLQILSQNPFRYVEKPKKNKTQVSTWSIEDIKKFLEATKKDEFYYPLFVTSLFTGMRKGEILGLTREDIDFENRVIEVKRAVSETKKHGVQLGEVKTTNSVRRIAINELTISVLRKRAALMSERKLGLGNSYNPHNLLFCNPDGGIFRPSSVNRPFRNYIKKAGVPYIRFHDTRHTHATLMMQLGINPKMVAERLGHATVKITLDTYSHVTSDMQKEAIQKLTNAFNQ
ncbi:site-specific integrase [Bacillus badius]|uniref:site-specific integrase n=1 Tax=Bacillus badius TaxID=1455 RepID=UPI001CBEBE75|nr:site-specific integrase [Bacillus badius]UAT29483.1 site-specific integrase [Bacillus badius]